MNLKLYSPDEPPREPSGDIPAPSESDVINDAMKAMVTHVAKTNWPMCCGARRMIGTSGFLCLECASPVLAFSESKMITSQVSPTMLREYFPELCMSYCDITQEGADL